VTRQATGAPEMRARLGELGLAPRALGSRAEVKAAVHGEIARWSRLVEAAKIERQ
jgi:tripartite-type tricarboxylate transporter receptor subunit TctC